MDAKEILESVRSLDAELFDLLRRASEMKRAAERHERNIKRKQDAAL